MRTRDLVQDAIWIAFSATLAWTRSAGRHWRRVVAATTMTIAIVRAVIWVAKAVASASTVDAFLNLIGLGAYVAPFEQAVDQVLATVVSLVMTVTPNG